MSGLAVEERAGLYERFVAALEQQKPEELRRAREYEAQKEKKIEESRKLASLFAHAGPQVDVALGATKPESDAEKKAPMASTGGFSFGFSFN